jgi:hypothetical protein
MTDRLRFISEAFGLSLDHFFNVFYPNTNNSPENHTTTDTTAQSDASRHDAALALDRKLLANDPEKRLHNRRVEITADANVDGCMMRRTQSLVK